MLFHHTVIQIAQNQDIQIASNICTEKTKYVFGVISYIGKKRIRDNCYDLL